MHKKKYDFVEFTTEKIKNVEEQIQICFRRYKVGKERFYGFIYVDSSGQGIISPKFKDLETAIKEINKFIKKSMRVV